MTDAGAAEEEGGADQRALAGSERRGTRATRGERLQALTCGPRSAAAEASARAERGGWETNRWGHTVACGLACWCAGPGREREGDAAVAPTDGPALSFVRRERGLRG